jgi:EAL domain-containing protein (putative c-di-GMP-specific phosphodiesterase class I)
VSVNVDARELRASGYVDAVEDAIDGAFPPSALIIELTDTARVEEEREAIETMNCLRELGPRLALDDFGTRASSLETLVRLPVDVLKIASPFVAAAGRSEHTALGLLACVVGLGRQLGLTTIAKGVERSEQRSALVGLGWELGQGHFLGRPLEAAEASELIHASGTSLLPPT